MTTESIFLGGQKKENPIHHELGVEVRISIPYVFRGNYLYVIFIVLHRSQGWRDKFSWEVSAINGWRWVNIAL